MASLDLAKDLMNKVLGHTGVKQAIRPWWNIWKDYCVVGVVILSIIVLPTSIFNDTPLDCNWCQKGYNALNKCETNYTNNATYKEKPNYTEEFVKKYCTYEYVDDYHLYFPYLHLCIGLLLFIMEPFFLSCCGFRMKLDAFFKLMKSKSFSDGTMPTTEDKESTELKKMAVKVAQSFRQSSTYYNLYIIRYTDFTIFLLSI